MNLSVAVQRQIDLFSQVTRTVKGEVSKENQGVIPMSTALVHHLHFPPFHFPEAYQGGNAWPNVFIPGTCEKIYRYGIHCLW